MNARGTFALDAGERRFVAVVVALAAVLRFYRLGHQSVWVDEMLTLVVTVSKPGYPISTLLLHDIHGPLHAFVVYLARFFAQGDAWLRLPSALAGVGAVVAIYYWVRTWLGSGVARAAAVLLAVNPLHIHYSQEIRAYAFLVFFSLVACIAFERLTRRGGRGATVAYAAAVAAATLSSFSAAFLYAAHALIFFMRRGIRRAALARWALVSVLILVLISPWVYRVTTYVDFGALFDPVAPGELAPSARLRGETTFTPAAVPYAGYTFSVGFSLGPSLRELHEDASLSGVVARHGKTVAVVALLFGGLFLGGAVRAFRASLRPGELAVYLAVPLALTLALSWQNAKAFNARYVMVSLPAYLCVLAIALHGMGRRARLAAWTAVMTVTAASLAHYYFDGRYAKEDVRGAVRAIEARAEPGDCILAPTVWHVVERYYRGDAVVRSVFQRDWLPKPRVDAQLEPLFAECNTVWYIRARPWVDDADGYLRRRLSEHYRTREVIAFNGVQLMRLQASDKR